MSAVDRVLGLDPCPPFAQVQDWFMHSLTLEQRRQFLVVWLPINRFDVKTLTTEMQFVALRHFYHRYRAAIADTHAKRGDSTEIEAPSLMSGGGAEGNRT